MNLVSNLKGSELDSLLQVLDQTIKNHQFYIDKRETRINGLKSLLNRKGISDNEKFKLNNSLFEEYFPYSQDSTLFYLTKNLSLAKLAQKLDWENETNLHLAFLLTNVGSYKEAFDILSSIKPSTVSSNLKSQYYICYDHIYSELYAYNSLISNQIEYNRLAKIYKDSLTSSLEPGSFDYLKNQESYMLEIDRINDAEKINTQLLLHCKEGTPEYAFVCFRRAIIYRGKKNKNLYKKFLILSTISDVKSAITNNASITLLALCLYEENDIERAYQYIQLSYSNAKFFNTRLRLIEVSDKLPLINAAYQNKSDIEKMRLKRALALITILSLTLFFALFFINRQRKRLAITQLKLLRANNNLTQLNENLIEFNAKLKNINLELTEANRIKEQYIGLFLSICSSYIDKLDTLMKKVNKHITSGKTAELYEYTKSKQFIDKELNEFYENFDKTFLNLFPNFVDDINSFLVVDEKIQIKKGELLNTELRIFALIRLGIADSSKIASLLRYSVNTIYNYRVKLKNKSAVPRDEFEDYVLRIASS